MSNTKFRRMAESDVKAILKELESWALGQLGSKLTWSILEERFGFSRQSLQAKSEIKAAYDNAKSALSGGLIKSKEQTSKENEQLICEMNRLKHEIDEFKKKEIKWKRRWQRIAFHLRQKGIQVSSVDKEVLDDNDLPNNTETAKILRCFDEEIPSSGRI